LETGDHGAFNSWGRDRFWSLTENIWTALPMPTRVNFTGCTTNNHYPKQQIPLRSWLGCRFDDGSSNYYIYNNVMLNGGLKFREGFKRKARTTS
jgi:hypothetical protein